MNKFFKVLMFVLVVSTLFLASCGNSETSDANAIYNPGTYVGEGESIGGRVEVAVTVDETSIVSIEFTEFNDSEFSIEPRDAMVEAIIAANSTQVDSISGASTTSEGIKTAVQMALDQAYVEGVNLETATTEKEAVVYEDATTDVLVIGGGGAGLSSAISAKQAGADVILIEKLAILGGNTNYATGGLNASETEQQKALGIEDDAETFYNDTMKGGKNLNDPELVKVLTEQSDEAVAWLTSLGADLTDVGINGGSTNPRSHRPTGGAPVGDEVVSVLSENAEEMGIDIRTSTRATEILVEDNKVVGATVETADGGTYTIHADAVVIATGGFGANNEIVASYRPELKGYGTTNAPGATGDVFTFAEDLDLALVDIDQIQIHPTVMPSNNYLISEAVRGTGAILVNREGKRFVNELLTRDVVSAAELEQTGQSVFVVFDQNVRDNYSAINGYYEKGFLIEAQTIEELAELIEVPVDALTETVNTYNGYVNAGVDEEFGRESMESTIEKGPFYAVEVAPAVHHTMGGIKIDPETRVYKNDGTYIDGLYAAGEVTGGVHGANRLGANAMTDITVFGYIAGENAAEYAATKE